MKLREGDELIGMDTIKENADVLAVAENGFGKRTPVGEYTVQNRGGIGLKNMAVTDKTGAVVGLKVVKPSQELMLISTEGIVIRTNIDEIRVTGRSAQGVKLMATGDTDKVASLATMNQKNDEPSN